MAREQMTPWEIEREDPSPDDLDAAAAFYDTHFAPPARTHEFKATALVPGWCVRCGEARWTVVHGGSGSSPTIVEVDGVVVAVTTRKELT